MKKAVYIGAGDDIKPLEYYSDDIKEFILVDSLPLTEFGDGYIGKKWYRKNFLPNLLKKMKESGFHLEWHDILKKIYHFTKKKENVSVYYFYSFIFPEHLNYDQEIVELLEKKIKDYDVLIVRGYDPHKKILEYSKKEIDFIGALSTVYHEKGTIDGYELKDNSTCRYLKKNNKKIKNVYLDEGNDDEPFKIEFDNYEDFLKYRYKSDNF